MIKQHLDAPVVAVVGPQGVGKSTFLHWLYGQIPGARSPSILTLPKVTT
ncbi:MAG: hypothetical protein HC812_13710, partial [Leptolyngbya sp. RL_3_1]|nr:hypothetical protein [Leptolyngbya sp. RL_3_1]